jgi:hypothetical protein
MRPVKCVPAPVAMGNPTDGGCGRVPLLLALKRAPSIPEPQPCDRVEQGGDGLAGQVIHYPTDIQPIFDAKCVSCHGTG